MKRLNAPAIPSSAGMTAEKLKGTVWKFTEDKTFKAKWQINQYQFAADCDQAKGQVSGTSLGTYDYGTEISVSAIP